MKKLPLAVLFVASSVISAQAPAMMSGMYQHGGGGMCAPMSSSTGHTREGMMKHTGSGTGVYYCNYQNGLNYSDWMYPYISVVDNHNAAQVMCRWEQQIPASPGYSSAVGSWYYSGSGTTSNTNPSYMGARKDMYLGPVWSYYGGSVSVRCELPVSTGTPSQIHNFIIN